MADETPPPPGGAGQPERRRPGPTIDLKATEIASAPMQPPQPPPAEPPADEPHGAAPEAQPPAGARGGWLDAVSWPLVGAGIAGAVVTLGAVWIVLLVTDRGADVSAAQQRIAQLERTVAGAASANSASSGDLAARLQKLEAQASSPRAPVTDPAVASRIAAVETQLKSLGETTDTLGRRSESTAAANAVALRELNEKLARSGAAEAQSSEASSEAANARAAQIAALASRVEAIEGGAKKLGEEARKLEENEENINAKLATALAQLTTGAADERAVRTGIIAAALTAAVERGAPFAPELAAAQAQAADPGALAPLAPFAATGLGDAGALARELAGLVPALRQAAAPAAPEGSFLERLSANAQRLVRVTPIDQAPGEDPPAVIARLEGDASRGDLAGALAELGKLAPAVRAPAQAWLAKAQARETALAASRAFASDALAALTKH